MRSTGGWTTCGSTSEARTLAQIQSDMTTPVPESGGVPDTLPPVISNVTASAGDTSVTVTWTTDEGSTSRVEYGPAVGYGSSTVLDGTLVTSHNVVLTGLTPDTQYHYRVRSRDASLNEAMSNDATVRTTVSAPTLVKAAYNFNAGSGTTVTDQTGRGNTLQLTNATWTTQGHTGGAVQFSGMNGSRAELQAPATDLAFTTAFTITAWVNPTALSTGWRAIAGRSWGRGSTTAGSWATTGRRCISGPAAR